MGDLLSDGIFYFFGREGEGINRTLSNSGAGMSQSTYEPRMYVTEPEEGGIDWDG